MNRTSLRRGLVPTAAALALALGFSACSAGNDSGSDNASDGGSSASGVSGDLAGGGSSAQEKAQAAWRAGFQTANPDANVTYDPVGSGDGRKNFISGAYMYAGSDSYLDDDEAAQAKETCGGDPIEVPAYVSPIAVIFNLDGVDELNLSPTTIADIFLGKITTWNDDEIAADNPDVDLPDTAIAPVHRSDESGTTANFTDYLSKTAPDAWTAEPDSVWPQTSGESAEGTSGLVGAVTDGQGTIGYADESAAGDLSQAAIKVGDSFEKPTADGAAKVLALSERVEGRADVDMAMDIDRTTTEAGAYPLLLASYLIACQTYDDADQAALVQGFLSYAVSADGQSAAADEAGSAPLDSSLQTEASDIVAKIAAS